MSTDRSDTSTAVPPLVVENARKVYRQRGGRKVAAVDGVSFTVEPGAAVGLVGASGSGKSTLAGMVTGSERPTEGSVRFGDLEVGRLGRRELRSYHSRVQMIFQDPYGALNPLHTVGYTVVRPVTNFLHLDGRGAHERVVELLETVGLTPPEQYLGKLPHQLSGGQRQRVLIARALACEPELLVADEPVSMLDVSLRADILRLLAQLRQDRGLSLLYITHDLLSARVVTDQLLVLNKGRVVERGETKQILQHPQDEYTVTLLDAIPRVGARRQRSRDERTPNERPSDVVVVRGAHPMTREQRHG
ncbi:ABC transporter ATP-binding protein [Nakamurella endophytica]|uniref:Dipeptide/oligopeptide/nickel ABC transporter ATP-binding protein n=1 Tax=Nakamurella endophytica TaxID=1748367 RepID=A0A917SPK9_9ACTN|nr:ABC transporter ATP-binding protein [Nakamurella endophytica]GGL90198.1 dipeptide/oligopeptide/nickel ABC transporter ATP-binding protein [Nakamurella endophytica]